MDNEPNTNMDSKENSIEEGKRNSTGSSNSQNPIPEDQRNTNEDEKRNSISNNNENTIPEDQRSPVEENQRNSTSSNNQNPVPEAKRNTIESDRQSTNAEVDKDNANTEFTGDKRDSITSKTSNGQVKEDLKEKRPSTDTGQGRKSLSNKSDISISLKPSRSTLNIRKPRKSHPRFSSFSFDGYHQPSTFPANHKQHHRRHHKTRYVSPEEKKSQQLLSAFFYEMFATREITPKGDRELYVKYSVRQFFIFMIFLFCLTTVAHSTTNEHIYFYKKTMTSIFIDEQINQLSWDSKSFRSISSVEDFWNYLEHGLMNNLYWEHYYSPENKTSYFVKNVDKPEEKGILYENELVGVPRLRQIRVKSNNCPNAEDFRHLTRRCYPTYSEDVEDHGQDGNIWNSSESRSGQPLEAWRYRNEDELNTALSLSNYWGELFIYSGNGAVQNLSKHKDETIKTIHQLKDNVWVNKSTRAVFLDFTVYNANVDLFCLVRILFEFPATGGIMGSHSIIPLHILHYDNWYEEYIVVTCEVLIAILSIYYLIQAIIEIYLNGPHDYISKIWSLLDLIVIINVWVALAGRIYLSKVTKDTIKTLDDDSDFQNLEPITEWDRFSSQAICICCVITWFRLFKYAAFNKTMAKLCGTLSRCSQDILGFSILFLIVFVAFAQLGYLQFGAAVKSFRSLEHSIYTLFRLILGDYDFVVVEDASPIIGPIFYVVYVFFIFFVLLNMFLAIMNDTYSEVKAEIQAQRNEFEVSDYLLRGMNNFLGLFGCRSTHLDAENAVKLSAHDGQLTFDEIIKNLRRSGFSETDIEIFLAHDMNSETETNCFDEEAAQQRLEMLQEKRDNESLNVPSQITNALVMSGQSSKFPIQFRSMAVLNSDLYSSEEKLEEMQNRVTALEGACSQIIHSLNDIEDII